MADDVEVSSGVRDARERFDALVSRRDMKVLDEFAPDDAVLLAGSEEGEVAVGRSELEAFFRRVFSRDVTFSWEWDRVEVFGMEGIAWLFAEGRVIVSSVDGERIAPYRMSGVLELHGERWVWRQFHGSEPAPGE